MCEAIRKFVWNNKSEAERKCVEQKEKHEASKKYMWSQKKVCVKREENVCVRSKKGKCEKLTNGRGSVD